MVCCAVFNCKRRSNSCNFTTEGVSYHTFPHDPIIKEKWIAATGRKDWFPTKHSTICSIHFENTSFIEGKKLRLLKKTACPTIDILKLIDNDEENKDTPQQLSPFSRRRKVEKEAGDEDSEPDPTAVEVPVTIKLEIEEEISEHEDDIMEQLENRKRMQAKDPIAIEAAKKVKIEYVPETEAPSQPLLQPIYQVVTQPLPQYQVQSQPLPQPQTQPATRPQPQPEASTEPVHVIPQTFMTTVVRNQNEIINILKHQVLLQDPDPDMLTFLRFLGSKLMRFPESKRKELQDQIYEIVLRE